MRLVITLQLKLLVGMYLLVRVVFLLAMYANE